MSFLSKIITKKAMGTSKVKENFEAAWSAHAQVFEKNHYMQFYMPPLVVRMGSERIWINFWRKIGKWPNTRSR